MKYLVDILSEIFTWCHTVIAAPTLLTATENPPDIDLAWVDNSDNEDGFNIWRSDDGTNWTQIDTVPANTESYTDTTAVLGVEYYYKVQAYSSSDTSDFSNTVQVDIALTAIKNGRLYNWYASVDARGIAPAGWHLPTANEMLALRNFLDPINNDPLTNVAGGLMKELSIYWDPPNTGADNSSGFTARGSGKRDGTSGSFVNLLASCSFWNSRDNSATEGGIGSLSNNDDNFFDALNSATLKKSGCSIRLLKDDATDPGIVVDYDGNVYPTVKIGTQVWMAANLIVTHYNNGDVIPYVNDPGPWAALITGGQCIYNNNYAYL